jgi:hypothetical protein
VVVIKIKDSRRKILRNDSYSEGRFWSTILRNLNQN